MSIIFPYNASSPGLMMGDMCWHLWACGLESNCPIWRQQSGLLRVSVARCPGHTRYYQSRVSDSVQPGLTWVKLIIFITPRMLHCYMIIQTPALRCMTILDWIFCPIDPGPGPELDSITQLATAPLPHVWCCHALTSLLSAPGRPIIG